MSEPANTWSNLGYLIVGAGCWWAARGSRSAAVRAFGPMAFVMGLSSLIYHASNIYPTQVLDFVGMFLYVFLIITINLRRLGWLSPGRQWPGYGLLVGLGTAVVHAMYLMELRYQWLIVLAVVVIVGTELRLWRRDAGGNTYGNFWWSLGLIVVAEVFSLLDATRIWCEPDNLLLHGHAIWHLVAAVSVGFAFVHYRQFDGELGPDGV